MNAIGRYYVSSLRGDGDGPKVPHETRQEAEQEAGRLCHKMNRPFAVMYVVSVARQAAPPVEFERIGDLR